MLKLIRLLCVAPLLLPTGVSIANDAVCSDPDGDGWGWDGNASCRVSAGNTPASAVCIDSDGDGWGWDGTSSCRVGQETSGGGSENTPGSACIDEDGDGWGWDGNVSCRVDNNGSGDGSASDNNASSICVDDDGDGWGWGPGGSCRVDGQSSSNIPAPQPPGNDNNTGGGNGQVIGRFNTATDVLSAHFDHGPDPDDGHAAAAAYVIQQETGIGMVVVGGTTGVYSASRYLPESESLMRNIWGQQWLDAHGSRQASIEQAARRWVAALAAGGDVWVAEGGPSDFTAAVVRLIRNQYPEFNTRSRVHVVQHSKWNEDHALAEDLNFVRGNTDYIRIDDGNDPNATADLRQDGSSSITQAFVQTARASRYQNVWNHAFNYLNPNDKLDFSDTVEILYVLGIGTNVVSNVTGFGQYFLR